MFIPNPQVQKLRPVTVLNGRGVMHITGENHSISKRWKRWVNCHQLHTNTKGGTREMYAPGCFDIGNKFWVQEKSFKIQIEIYF